MKVTKTKTCWEVYDSKSKHSSCEMGRPREDGGNGEDFRHRREAEEYAREAGYRWVKEIAFAVDEEGIDYEHVCRERFYRVQPSVITAHARCCRCGQATTFENGVLAYDWKFEHEVMHNLQHCVETWETDLAYPDETFPLRKRVNGTLVSITDTPEPAPPALLSVEDED
jgi:hypothetical protein